MYWETIWAKDVERLRLWAHPCDPGDILEFDSMAELKAFDPCFLHNNKINIFENICNVLDCAIEDIKQIESIDKGITNHKFKFTVNDVCYIYRHSGINSRLLVDRKRESAVLNAAKKYGLTGSLVHMDADEGWMISKFISDTETFELDNPKHTELLVQKLKILHTNKVCSGRQYDYKVESDKLLKMLRNVAPEKYQLAVCERDLMQPVFEFLEKDKWQISLCHNDIYADNILVKDNGLELIDWEYGGDADIGFDICKLFGMSNMPYDDIDRWLYPYYQRKTTDEERKHLFACAAVCYYHWFVWALYKSVRNNIEIKDLPVWHEKMTACRIMALQPQDRSVE